MDLEKEVRKLSSLVNRLQYQVGDMKQQIKKLNYIISEKEKNDKL